MVKYKITILKILDQSLTNLLYLLAILALNYFLILKNPKPEWELREYTFFIILFFIMIYFLVIYPLCIVYNHYKYDKDTVLLIDNKAKKILYKSKELSKEFPVSDILSIKKYRSDRMFYIVFYYELFLKDETMIRLSSLLMLDIDKIFKDVKLRRERTNDLLLHRKSS